MSTPVKTDGRVARRVGTRDAIMGAAAELFAVRGVTSTSIDEIAEKAGIAKGSIYYNFESKAGLVEAVMVHAGEVMAETMAHASAGRHGIELRAAVVRALLALVRDHVAEARMMVTELFRTDRSWRESIEDWRAITVAPLVHDLEASGIGPAQARLQAAAILGAVLTAAMEWLVFHPEYDYDDVADAVVVTLGH